MATRHRKPKIESLRQNDIPEKSIKPRLRFATYMCPSLPVEYYETVTHYLESKLDVHTSLLYESRWEGPPADREDPFTTNEVDIAFVNSNCYFRFLQTLNEFVELLPLSSIHNHPKGEGKPGYFADVVIHAELVDRVKEFMDLRGSKWAVNHPDSTSGNLIALLTLKQLGENATFFGTVLQSGSHVKSLEMILDKKADAAAVDSNCLKNFLTQHPEAKKNLQVLESWGPLAPYPILINKRVDGDLKAQIILALQNMHQDMTWSPRLAKFNVQRFTPISSDVYDKDRQLLQQIKGNHLVPAYY